MESVEGIGGATGMWTRECGPRILGHDRLYYCNPSVRPSRPCLCAIWRLACPLTLPPAVTRCSPIPVPPQTHHIGCKLPCDGQKDELEGRHEVRIAHPGAPPGHVDGGSLTAANAHFLRGTCSREELALCWGRGGRGEGGRVCTGTRTREELTLWVGGRGNDMPG